MQIDEVDALPSPGLPYYFSAVLYEGFPFWSVGPHGPDKGTVINALHLLHRAERATLSKTYVPYAA